MKTSTLIKKLQELVEQEGDLDFTIYNSFEKRTLHPREGDIFFDSKTKDIYIGIYR